MCRDDEHGIIRQRTTSAEPDKAPQPQTQVCQTHTKAGNGGGMHRTQSRHRCTGKTTIRLITIFAMTIEIQTMNASNGEHESINQHVKTTLKTNLNLRGHLKLYSQIIECSKE